MSRLPARNLFTRRNDTSRNLGPTSWRFLCFSGTTHVAFFIFYAGTWKIFYQLLQVQRTKKYLKNFPVEFCFKMFGEFQVRMADSWWLHRIPGRFLRGYTRLYCPINSTGSSSLHLPISRWRYYFRIPGSSFHPPCVLLCSFVNYIFEWITGTKWIVSECV